MNETHGPVMVGTLDALDADFDGTSKNGYTVVTTESGQTATVRTVDRRSLTKKSKTKKNSLSMASIGSPHSLDALE